MKKLTLVIEYDGDIDTVTDALNEALHQIAYDEGRYETIQGVKVGYTGLDWEYLSQFPTEEDRNT